MSWDCKRGSAQLLLFWLGLLLTGCAGVGRTSVKPQLFEKQWRSYDGKVMPWHPGNEVKGKPRAVVITIHGLSGASSDFWMLDEEWPPRGIDVYGLQLRGQGNDPDKGQRGNIASAPVWQKDLLTFHELIRARHPGVPVYWYAESLGTLIAMHTVTELMPDSHTHPDGIIMSAPAAGLRLRPSGLKSAALTAAVKALPWARVNLERLAGVDDKNIRVTHDTTYGAQMAVTSHFVKTFSLRLLGEVDKMMRTAPASARKLRVPVLILASPNDVIASEQQIQDLHEAIGSEDKTINWYRESYHLLLHDKQRDEVLKDATHWLEKHIKD